MCVSVCLSLSHTLSISCLHEWAMVLICESFWQPQLLSEISVCLSLSHSLNICADFGELLQPPPLHTTTFGPMDKPELVEAPPPSPILYIPSFGAEEEEVCIVSRPLVIDRFCTYFLLMLTKRTARQACCVSRSILMYSRSFLMYSRSLSYVRTSPFAQKLANLYHKPRAAARHVVQIFNRILDLRQKRTKHHDSHVHHHH